MSAEKMSSFGPSVPELPVVDVERAQPLLFPRLTLFYSRLTEGRRHLYVGKRTTTEENVLR